VNRRREVCEWECLVCAREAAGVQRVLEEGVHHNRKASVGCSNLWPLQKKSQE
jgi:hypothetical protein